MLLVSHATAANDGIRAFCGPTKNTSSDAFLEVDIRRNSAPSFSFVSH